MAQSGMAGVNNFIDINCKICCCCCICTVLYCTAFIRMENLIFVYEMLSLLSKQFKIYLN